jgi:hypothetical protein
MLDSKLTPVLLSQVNRLIVEIGWLPPTPQRAEVITHVNALKGAIKAQLEIHAQQLAEASRASGVLDKPP